MRVIRMGFAILALCGAAHAATIAVTNDGGGSGAVHGNFDLAGYQFSNSGQITITDLGIWQGASGTLSQSHQVGVYNLSGILQFAVTIPTDVPADAQGYGYVPLATPGVLNPGTWFIGAYYVQGSPDRMRDNGTAPAMAAGLTFVTAETYHNSSAFDPNSPSGNPLFIANSTTRGSYFGPNFQFVPTPEPGTASLLLFALPAFVILKKRHR